MYQNNYQVPEFVLEWLYAVTGSLINNLVLFDQVSNRRELLYDEWSVSSFSIRMTQYGM